MLNAPACLRHCSLRPSLLYRLFSTESSTRDAVRELLRETAQSVAIVTSIMPDTAGSTTSRSPSHFHGATLSSFTSVAMDPYPLIAFSLRIPSRMAASLKSLVRDETAPHMVVNILSSSQPQAAIHFSRPDLYPEPFHSHRYSLTEEGMPVLIGSLGALSCRLLSCLPLHDLQALGGKEMCHEEGRTPQEGGMISELFIARVLRVENTGDRSSERTLPLLYHRRQYATVVNVETAESTSSDKKL